MAGTPFTLPWDQNIGKEYRLVFGGKLKVTSAAARQVADAGSKDGRSLRTKRGVEKGPLAVTLNLLHLALVRNNLSENLKKVKII
jgi:hypothetical protein